jgi:hypothetical protein
LPRFAVDTAAALAVLPYIASGARDLRPASGSLDHILGRVGETLDGAGTVLAEALPFSSLLWGPLGPAILVLTAAGVALAVKRGGPARAAALGWMAAGAGGVAFGLAGLVMLLPAESYYVPRVEGIANRFSAAAAPGEVVMLVALAFLVGIAAAALTRRRRLQTPLAVALLAIAAAGMVRTEVRHQRVWADSWTQAQGVQGAIRRALGPELPPGARVVTFRHTLFLAPEVPVFGTTWDLRGAVRLLYDDPTLEGQPFNPGYSCDPDGMRARSPGAADILLPYGDLFFVDATTYRGARVADQRACGRWRARLGV